MRGFFLCRQDSFLTATISCGPLTLAYDRCHLGSKQLNGMHNLKMGHGAHTYV